MKKFSMNLHPAPFASIESGKKDVEMRLATPERLEIQAGDLIVFTNRADGRQLVKKVAFCRKYPSFAELYADFDKTRIGYEPGESPDPNDMLLYYKQEDIDRYGALAIGLEKE